MWRFQRTPEADKLDAFFEAVDSDDFRKVSSLLRGVGLDPETIRMVLKKMADPDGEH